jgi:GNAT superfamily N-acetyltransferase
MARNIFTMNRRSHARCESTYNLRILTRMRETTAWESSMPLVTTAVAADKDRVVHTIVLAFAADPMARWVWPGATQYLESMPAFTLAFGGGAFANEAAHRTSDYAGAALWLPPDVHADERTMGEITERTVAPAIRGELYAVLEQMGSFHPREPHWYLPLIGVDPAHQGKGCGAALLSYALERCDRDRLPAYLESTNPRNIGLYKRHGFVEVGEIQAGSSPKLVPMLRTPR